MIGGHQLTRGRVDRVIVIIIHGRVSLVMLIIVGGRVDAGAGKLGNVDRLIDSGRWDLDGRLLALGADGGVDGENDLLVGGERHFAKEVGYEDASVIDCF